VRTKFSQGPSMTVHKGKSYAISYAIRWITITIIIIIILVYLLVKLYPNTMAIVFCYVLD